MTEDKINLTLVLKKSTSKILAADLMFLTLWPLIL